VTASEPSAIPLACQAFWDAFQTTVDQDLSARFHEAYYFCDSAAQANPLAQRVLEGTKRATTGLLWSYEAEGEALPEAGQLCIVTTFDGAPVAVVETEAVRVLPFEDVSAEYAHREGEGDKSLEHWQSVHWAFFERECARLGREPHRRMRVVCETFARRYPSEIYPVAGGDQS
jgi:uncharacterized protein YhfF